METHGVIQKLIFQMTQQSVGAQGRDPHRETEEDYGENSLKHTHVRRHHFESMGKEMKEDSHAWSGWWLGGCGQMPEQLPEKQG